MVQKGSVVVKGQSWKDSNNWVVHSGPTSLSARFNRTRGTFKVVVIIAECTRVA